MHILFTFLIIDKPNIWKCLYGASLVEEDENSPANAGNMGSLPVPGRPHICGGN